MNLQRRKRQSVGKVGFRMSRWLFGAGVLFLLLIGVIIMIDPRGLIHVLIPQSYFPVLLIGWGFVFCLIMGLRSNVLSAIFWPLGLTFLLWLQISNLDHYLHIMAVVFSGALIELGIYLSRKYSDITK